ncbi:MAG: hypothetical protein EOL98_03760 [Negativicutes bacterium]|nr:hypothetical protein [Negativicutes bacterium]
MLSELYNGNIVPQSRPIPKDSKYRELQNDLGELADSLAQRLNDEDKQVLDEIMITWSNISTVNGEDCFIEGFRLGARMILEIFEKDDELLDLKEV